MGNFREGTYIKGKGKNKQKLVVDENTTKKQIEDFCKGENEGLLKKILSGRRTDADHWRNLAAKKKAQFAKKEEKEDK